MFRKLPTLLLILLCLVAHAGAQKLLDDRQIRIKSAADVSAKRHALIQYIWGAGELPTEKLPRLPVIKGDRNPISRLSALERVDTLIVDMENGVKSYAHHFIPRYRNGRLVILHAGHYPSFNDVPGQVDEGWGMYRSIEGLMFDGYSVLAVYMPRNVQFNTTIKVSDDGGYDAHNDLILNPKYKPLSGNALKYFFEPINAYLNYLATRSAKDDFPAYSDFSIVGLSGGGWAATVYSAMDTRIKVSVSVAGSIPMYLRSGGSIGDAEQTVPEFYSIAGYPELYVMASDGPGRKHVQVLNRTDWCCFSEKQHDPKLAGGLSFTGAVREFETNVRETLIALGNSDLFYLEIDEVAPDHNVSWDAIYDTILPELNESRRYIATATGEEAVARGIRGNPAIFINDFWNSSKIPVMMGTPALLRGGVNIYDMFYRTTDNQLVHVSRPPMVWSRPLVLLDKVISDPAAASPGPGRFDVVVLGPGYKYYHISRNGSGTSVETVSNEIKGLGQPTLIASAPDRLDLFFRGWGRQMYYASKIGNAPWNVVDVGGLMTDLPTAVRTSDGGFRAYVRGWDMKLWEVSRGPSDSSNWSSWSPISYLVQSGELRGSPSAAIVSGEVNVFVRTPDSKLRNFVLKQDWSFSDLDNTCVGSPTAAPGGTFTRSPTGSLSYVDGRKLMELGGNLD